MEGLCSSQITAVPFASCSNSHFVGVLDTVSCGGIFDPGNKSVWHVICLVWVVLFLAGFHHDVALYKHGWKLDRFWLDRSLHDQFICNCWCSASRARLVHLSWCCCRVDFSVWRFFRTFGKLQSNKVVVKVAAIRMNFNFMLLCTLGQILDSGLLGRLCDPLTGLSAFRYSCRIYAGSIVPTLLPSDYLVADKSTCGYSRFSFVFSLIDFDGRTSGKSPSRGDVVVFDKNGISYVKRIIGLPGETVQPIDGITFIDGRPFKQEVISAYQLDYDAIQATEVRESLPDGRSYSVLDLEQGTMADNTAQFMVASNHYFMLGDHRDNSADSRCTLGYVSLESFVGRVDRIYANENGYPFKERSDFHG